MGMDLKPIEPSANAPTTEKYGITWGGYSWAGWVKQIDYLQKWGIDTSEFSNINDGEVISKETCLKVADAIEQHLDELSEEHKLWLHPKIELWRTCGGYEQH
jgi:hypothetical protein